MWDFWSLSPETLHQVMILMSDRGIPQDFRHMHGFGSHTFSFYNEYDERCWVKFHLRCMQGIAELHERGGGKDRGERPGTFPAGFVREYRERRFPEMENVRADHAGKGCGDVSF